ncbi:hypothetical protein NE857_04810 [Nocardiopsis exhalans]|uniref:ABM domain-containing protein n=1 Tax=Nocardiopsis exhalans TaxID=163604 RepID=A0ABY5D9F3_9ACTN|nr:hypothetical protein [Nocardiopsis exhalans]USY20972.1 hypothetical protein NE857_04810 [Nocardiopsis exhalans]
MPTEREATILFHNTMRVTEGHWEGFRLAARRAVDFTERHTPQIMVDFFTDEANMLAHSFQLYADSASIRAHWRMSGAVINDVMDHCSVERLDVYGEPDAQVTRALEAFRVDVPVTVHPRLAGFTRFGGPSPDR